MRGRRKRASGRCRQGSQKVNGGTSSHLLVNRRHPQHTLLPTCSRRKSTWQGCCWAGCWHATCKGKLSGKFRGQEAVSSRNVMGSQADSLRYLTLEVGLNHWPDQLPCAPQERVVSTQTDGGDAGIQKWLGGEGGGCRYLWGAGGYLGLRQGKRWEARESFSECAHRFVQALLRDPEQ
jgi:hypothetical protein